VEEVYIQSSPLEPFERRFSLASFQLETAGGLSDPTLDWERA